MCSINEAFTERQTPVPMSDSEAHNVGIGMELTRHARSMSKDHPDRQKFLLEAARIRAGMLAGAEDSALKDLTEPYEIPQDKIRERRQSDVDNCVRFQKEVLGIKSNGVD